MKKKYLIITFLFSFTLIQAFPQDTTKISRRKNSRKNATTLHRNLGDTTVNKPYVNSSKSHAEVNNNGALNTSGTTSGYNPSTQFIIPLNKNKKHLLKAESDTSK